MDMSCKMVGRFKFTFDERFMDDQLCPLVCDKTLPPDPDLSPHRFEATLQTIHANRNCIDEVEVFCKLESCVCRAGEESPLQSLASLHGISIPEYSVGGSYFEAQAAELVLTRLSNSHTLLTHMSSI